MERQEAGLSAAEPDLLRRGVTVSDYITRHRLSYANKLLQQPNREYTIEEIAKKSGFGSRNRFYDGYRAIYGITPTEFRNLSEKNPHQKVLIVD